MTVFVTGSSRGIGKAIAAKFHQSGANVALNCANSPQELAETEREFLAFAPNVLAIRADMADFNQAKAAVNLIESTFGGIDALVNNAGIAHFGLFQDMRPEEWRRLIDVNLCATLNCTKLAVPHMLSQKRGAIINISSVWGEQGASCEAAYSLTKGGLNAFTKALAKELAPSGITVNAIACGAIETDMNARLTPAERQALKERIPANRFGTPAEVAELAHFLASPAANYITAQIINIDGGGL